MDGLRYVDEPVWSESVATNSATVLFQYAVGLAAVPSVAINRVIVSKAENNYIPSGGRSLDCQDVICPDPLPDGTPEHLVQILEMALSNARSWRASFKEE